MNTNFRETVVFICYIIFFLIVYLWFGYFGVTKENEITYYTSIGLILLTPIVIIKLVIYWRKKHRLTIKKVIEKIKNENNNRY
jgi:hypothetical protein